jgi:hypothetical protein
MSHVNVVLRSRKIFNLFHPVYDVTLGEVDLSSVHVMYLFAVRHGRGFHDCLVASIASVYSRHVNTGIYTV